METENVIDILRQIEKTQTLPFSIEVLNLSIRVHHALARDGINTIGDLVKNWEIVPRVRNLGAKGILEINEKLNLWYQTEGILSLSGFANFVPGNQVVIDEQTTGNQAINERPTWQDESLSNIPIEVLDLPIRAYHILKRENINTVGQIYIEWKNIGSFRNIGPTALEQIQKAITSFQDPDAHQEETEDETSFEIDSYGLASNLSELSPKNQTLISIEIRKLDLNNRIIYLLKKNNIYTVDQITSDKLDELSSARIIRPATRSQIQSAILAWLSQDEKRQSAYLAVMKGKGIIALPREMTLKDYINSIFKPLSPRYISIIEFRYGLKTGKKTTLEETAKYVEVTRERIRQIESQALSTLKQQIDKLVPSPFFAIIKEIIDTRGGLISKSRLIDELQSSFIEINYSAEGIINLFNGIFPEKINLNQDDVKITYISTISGWSTSSFDKDQILLTANKILEILSKSESPMQWDELFPVLVCQDGLLTLDESLAHAIALCLSDQEQIYRRTDGGWTNQRDTRYSRIISVMRQIGQPAHFSEIAELYNQTYPEWPISEHNLHAIIGRHGEFVRVGKGKYGLAEWGMHDDGNISNAVRRILVSHNHPMPFTDIVDEVLKTWDVGKSSIIAAIDIDARFSKTKDGNIWLTETGLTLSKRKKRDDDTRVDRLLVEMRNLGQPSSIQLIVDTHNKSCPERPFTVPSAKMLMYRKPGLFTRTGPEEFGLAEWGLESFQEISFDRNNEILEIIKMHGPLRFDTLRSLYNHQYSDRPLGESSFRAYLGAIRGLISSPQKGIYQCSDQVVSNYQVPAISHANTNGREQDAAAIADVGSPAIRSEEKAQPSPSDGRFEKILKIVAAPDHPSMAIILERYNQQNPEDCMAMEGFLDYLKQIKNRS